LLGLRGRWQHLPFVVQKYGFFYYGIISCGAATRPGLFP
jgi:hypothetical protein